MSLDHGAFAGTQGSRTRSNDEDDKGLTDLQQINIFVLPFITVCFLALLAYFGLTREAGVACLWALSSLSAGGAVGFLFGIPKISIRKDSVPDASTTGAAATGTGAPARAPNLRPNTNLEEVSDWLTKIIVGLGLVNLGHMGEEVARISANAASGWPNVSGPQGVSIATALITGFATTGFLASYVYTRLFLQGAFDRGDQGLGEAIERQSAKLAPANTASGSPAVLTAPELRGAEYIKQATTVDDLPLVTEKMRQLAREYEQIRQFNEPGNARTQKMANLVQKMRLLALAAMPAVNAFINSESAGERLAAVAMLQTRYDPQFTVWLADRLVEERPFVGFNAASALLSASQNLAGEPLRVLCDAVRSAQQRLTELGLKDEQRDQLISRILKNDPRGNAPVS